MSTKNIDFESLPLVKALDLAVLIEEEAKERYEEFAEQMEVHRTPEAARFFEFMAANEEKHRAELAARREQLFGDEPSEVTRAMLFDIEAPDYNEARAFMTAGESLATAMQSEKKAWEFFDRLIPKVTDPDVRALFEELREEELEHQKLVQEQIDQLPPEDQFRVEDFEDPPAPLD